MIEPSESARRISSALARFGVALDGSPAAQDPDVLASRRGFGMMLGPLSERLLEELEGADVEDSTKRLLKLRVRQLDDVADALQAATPGDRFEAADLAILASFLDLMVTMFSAAVGKEFRAGSL